MLTNDVDILSVNILIADILSVNILSVDIFRFKILSIDILSVDILNVDILIFNISSVDILNVDSLILRQKKEFLKFFSSTDFWIAAWTENGNRYSGYERSLRKYL